MTDSTAAETAFSAFLEEVLAWKGSLGEAQQLRAKVQTLTPPRRKGKTPEEQALLTVISAYGKKNADRLFVDPEQEPMAARVVGPFLGDGQMGAWPWDDPLRFTNASATKWLPLLSRFGSHDDKSILDFAWTVYGARPRRVWTAASIALAELGLRNDAVREELVEEWRRCFGNGLPQTWQGPSLVRQAEGRSEGDDEPLVHRGRHILHTLCAYAGRGGDMAACGLSDLARLAEMPLRSDPSDASVILLAIGELLLASGQRSRILAALPDRAREAPADPMVYEALRAITERLGAFVPPVSAPFIEARLQLREWSSLKGSTRAEVLWGWLETALWAQGSGREPLFEKMLESAGEAAYALHLLLHPLGPTQTGDAITSVLERVRAVFDPLVFATTPDASRALLVVELAALLRDPSVSELPWRELLTRAVGEEIGDRASRGTAGTQGLADLIVCLARYRYTPAFLLRNTEFDKGTVVSLAACQESNIAIQVALQSERLLREQIVEGQEQVRFLWWVLQQDPPAKLFIELRKMLRGVDTPLHRMVDAAGHLDACRTDPVTAAIARAHADFVGVAGNVLGLSVQPEEPDVAKGLVQVAEALERIVEDNFSTSSDPSPVGSQRWLDDFREFVLGTDSLRGIDWLMYWLDRPLLNAQGVWERFERGITVFAGLGDQVTHNAYNDVMAATADLRLLLSKLPWPQVIVVGAALDRTAAWASALMEASKLNESRRRGFRRILAQGSEQPIMKMVQDSTDPLDYLAPGDLDATSRFLLSRLRLGTVRRLRRRVSDRVALPGITHHFSPLFQGAIGGVFIVLDIGTPWLELIGSGRPTPYIATVLLSLVTSFGLLWASLDSLGRFSGAGLRRHLAFGSRVLGIWFAAFLLALAVSAVVLWTLAGTSIRESGPGAPYPFGTQVLLFASLAMVFGVLIQVIFRGRSPVQMDP